MYCTNCGAPNADTAKFCMKCGQPLAAPPAPVYTPPPAPPPAAAVYTPPPAPPAAAWSPPPAAPPQAAWAQAPRPAPARPAPPRPRARWPWVLAIVVMALILIVVAGGLIAMRYFRIGSNEAVALLPEDTSMVFSVSPSVDQLLALQKHLSAGTLTTLGGAAAAPAAAAGGIDTGMLGELTGGLDIDLQKDVLPWMGGEVTAGLVDTGEGQPAPVAAIAVRNAKAAAEFTDKIRDQLGAGGGEFFDDTYEGVDYTYNENASYDYGLAYAQVNGYLVVTSSEAALKRVIETSQGQGDGLDANATYKSFSRQIGGGRAGYLYLGMEDLMRLTGGGLEDLQAVLPLQAVGAKFSLDNRGMRMDYIVELDTAELSTAQEDVLLSGRTISNRILDAIPADAVVAVTGPGLRETLDQLALLGGQGLEISGSIDEALSMLGIDYDDLTGWMGDEWALVGLEAGDQPLIPDVPFDFLAVFQAADRKKAANSLGDLVSMLEEQAGVTGEDVELAGSDFTLIRDPYSGGAVGYGIVGDYAVIGLSESALERAAEAAAAPLSRSSAFRVLRGKLPSRNNGLVYVNVQPLLDLVYASMDDYARQDFDRQFGPYVKNIEALGLASEPARDGVLRGSIYVLLTEESMR